MKTPNPKIRNLMVTAFYTSESGTYCSVVPTEKTKLTLGILADYLQKQGFETLSPLDYHVTVMYSKDAISREEQQGASEVLQSDKIYEASIVHATHWKGSKDKGYIVLELESEQLTKTHNFMKEEFGLETSWPDYRIHVTLVEDAYDSKDKDNLRVQNAVNTLNRMIGQKPYPLTFTGLRVEDLAD